MARRSPVRNRHNVFIEHQHAAEMHRTRANCLCAPYETFILRSCKMQLEFYIPWIRYFWPSHGEPPWQSACVLGFGGHFLPAPNESFAVRKTHLATLFGQFKFLAHQPPL